MKEHSDSAKSVRSGEDRLRFSGQGAEVSVWPTDDKRLHELADDVRRRYSRRARAAAAEETAPKRR